MFLFALGSEAGGMALSTLSYGGVHIAGGITKRDGMMRTLQKVSNHYLVPSISVRTPSLL